jgi:hypothetical protein
MVYSPHPRDLIVMMGDIGPPEMTVVTGLQFWLDADNYDSLTINGGTQMVTSVANSVEGGSGTLGNASSGPLYEPEGLNGKPTLTFNSGTNKALYNYNWSFSFSLFTCYIVRQVTGTSSEGQYVVNIYDNTRLFNTYYSISTVTDKEVLYYNNLFGADERVITPRINGPAIACIGTQPMGEAPTLKIGKLVVDSTVSEHGTYSGDGSAPTYDMSSANLRFYVGRASGSYGYLKGHISELLFYSRELTNPEHTIVKAYLKAKWGIS